MDDLTTKLPEWERQAEEYERKARALRQIIDGVRALNGEAAQLFNGTVGTVTVATEVVKGVVGREGPRGREAIRIIAAEQPGDWKVKEIKDEILRRGWPDPGTGAEAALKRLASSGEAERIGHGTYRIGRQQIEPVGAVTATGEVE